MYYIRWRPALELGINAEYSFITHSLEISNVLRDSPAPGAGLRLGDRIVAINGWRLTSTKPFDDTWGKVRPGEKVEH
jgi:predicted metalloprotease with PDZ domain